MFATLLGGLPPPPHGPSPTAERADSDEVEVVRLVATAIEAQDAAGLEPLTDGRLRDPGFQRLGRRLVGDGDAAATWEVVAAEVVAAWRSAAAATERDVKQALPGPYSLGRWSKDDPNRARRTIGAAEAIGEIIAALAAAGCPLVEIEESGIHGMEDDADRRLFADAHLRLLDAGDGRVHRSLSIVGGAPPKVAIDSLVDLPYASIAVDLIAGPDSWDLVARLPRERGVIAGVVSNRDAADEPREILLWAAHYAASTGGRGLARVGLGSAGSYANLTWEAAVRKMTRLGDAARLAALPPSEGLSRQLDPASISARRAALGHDAPPPPRRRR